MDILEKYGIRYCQSIDYEMINAFVLQNMEDFVEVFSGLSHPLEAAQHFERLSEKKFGAEIKSQLSVIKSCEDCIRSFENDIERNKDELEIYEKTGFLQRLFQGKKRKKVVDHFRVQIEHLGKSVQRNKDAKKEAEQVLHELRSTVNYWEIFHEAAMDAYAELVSINSMHAHLDLSSFSMMREYYLAAEGLNGVQFDMQVFLGDGLVNTIFAISDSVMEANGGCTVGQSIDKLCNIKAADHLTRKHIFSKLMGSGINMSMINSIPTRVPEEFGTRTEVIA